MRKIYCFHLLNDFSGSPKVLSQLIKGWIKNGYEVHLSTSLSRDGFLSNIEGLHYHDNAYQFRKNKILRLFMLLYSQLNCLIKFSKRIAKDDVIYINTVLPFGAGVLGKLKGIKVIYHIHETSITPVLLKHFLFGLAKWTADKAIFVSNFLAEQESGFKNQVVLYNAIGDDFLERAQSHLPEERKVKNILMICSLKKYKGVDEFWALAQSCPKYSFRLVVNASEEEIGAYFKDVDLPTNIEVFPTQKDVHPFYQWSDVVLNLSRTDEWLETFGLTVIEAGAYGKPVVVPPKGGIAELVEEGIHGYKINGHDRNEISKKLNELSRNEDLYEKMRVKVLGNVKLFSEKAFIQKSINLIDGKFI